MPGEEKDSWGEPPLGRLGRAATLSPGSRFSPMRELGLVGRGDMLTETIGSMLAGINALELYVTQAPVLSTAYFCELVNYHRGQTSVQAVKKEGRS